MTGNPVNANDIERMWKLYKAAMNIKDAADMIGISVSTMSTYFRAFKKIENGANEPIFGVSVKAFSEFLRNHGFSAPKVYSDNFSRVKHLEEPFEQTSMECCSEDPAEPSVQVQSIELNVCVDEKLDAFLTTLTGLLEQLTKVLKGGEGNGNSGSDLG